MLRTVKCGQMSQCDVIMYEVLSMLGPLAPFIVQYLSSYARSAPTPGSTGTSCSSGCFSITKSSRVLLHVCQCHYGPTVFQSLARNARNAVGQMFHLAPGQIFCAKSTSSTCNARTR